MIQIRRASERGHFDHGWLKTFHTFSFADYHDPAHMGFRSLRVINEDFVAAETGFGMHGHRDMEILTYILSGALAHEDSMGNQSTIRPGEIQRMTAGKGVLHSETNASKSGPVHLLQIWIHPNEKGLPPSYEQLEIPRAETENRWRVIASPVGGNGAVKIHQHAFVSCARLERGNELSWNAHLHRLRYAWLQLARGSVVLDCHHSPAVTLQAGDGVAISDEDLFLVKASEDSELLLFDLE